MSALESGGRGLKHGPVLAISVAITVAAGPVGLKGLAVIFAVMSLYCERKGLVLLGRRLVSKLKFFAAVSVANVFVAILAVSVLPEAFGEYYFILYLVTLLLIVLDSLLCLGETLLEIWRDRRRRLAFSGSLPVAINQDATPNNTEGASIHPGSRLLIFAKMFFSRKTYQTILLPTISDLQEEYEVARSDRRYWELDSILERGYYSFWAAVLAHVASFLARALRAIHEYITLRR